MVGVLVNDRVNVLLNENEGRELVMDQSVIARALSGDHEAFRWLVEKYHSDVASTVNAMLGPGDEAEDVGQETFIRFYQSLGQFRGQSSLRTYLKRIAINLSLNAIKKRQRTLMVLDGELEAATSNDPLPDARLEASERSAFVHNALLDLSEEHRSVVVLRMIDGYSTEETAEMLKVPVGTVLSRLARATKKLKDLLNRTM